MKKIENLHGTLQKVYYYNDSPLIAVGKAEQLMIHLNFEAAYLLLEQY
jgi:hypothetical protein